MRSRRPVAIPSRRLRVRTQDGVDLLIGLIEMAPDKASDVLLFFHGAGAHMSAGYLDLGRGIHECCCAAVALPDLRGHGGSGGPPGFVDCRTRIWSDVDAVVNAVVERYPRARVHLGGHSLGASLCLNWVALPGATKSHVRSMILLAPYTDCPTVERPPPSGVQPLIRFNGVRYSAGARGAGDAVSLSYPPDIAAAAKLVCRYNAEMFLALAPDDFVKQLQASDRPISIFAARDDELFCARAMEGLIPDLANLQFSVVEGGHLTCLYFAHTAICQALMRYSSVDRTG